MVRYSQRRSLEKTCLHPTFAFHWESPVTLSLVSAWKCLLNHGADTSRSFRGEERKNIQGCTRNRTRSQRKTLLDQQRRKVHGKCVRYAKNRSIHLYHTGEPVLNKKDNLIVLMSQVCFFKIDLTVWDVSLFTSRLHQRNIVKKVVIELLILPDPLRRLLFHFSTSPVSASHRQCS